MTNHLRIALKHLLDERTEKTEVVEGNYRVNKTERGPGLIAIDHLGFQGEDAFHSCRWDPSAEIIYIPEGENCPSAEVIFVLRTIKKLGCRVERIIYGVGGTQNDMSHLYAKYLNE